VLDCQTEIASDFSVFHRIADPMSLPSSQYFDWAELLPAYPGAMRVVEMARMAPPPAAAAPQSPPAGLDLYGEPVDSMSPAELAAMSGGWIEHTGG
jgi:hypothetical protein